MTKQHRSTKKQRPATKKQRKSIPVDFLSLTQSLFPTPFSAAILTRSHQLQLGDVAAISGHHIEDLVERAVSTFLEVEAPVLRMHNHA